MGILKDDRKRNGVGPADVHGVLSRISPDMFVQSEVGAVGHSSNQRWKSQMMTSCNRIKGQKRAGRPCLAQPLLVPQENENIWSVVAAQEPSMLLERFPIHRRCRCLWCNQFEILGNMYHGCVFLQQWRNTKQACAGPTSRPSRQKAATVWSPSALRELVNQVASTVSVSTQLQPTAPSVNHLAHLQSNATTYLIVRTTQFHCARANIVDHVSRFVSHHASRQSVSFAPWKKVRTTDVLFTTTVTASSLTAGTCCHWQRWRCWLRRSRCAQSTHFHFGIHTRATLGCKCVARVPGLFFPRPVPLSDADTWNIARATVYVAHTTCYVLH